MDQSKGQRGGDRVSPVSQRRTSEREAQILELRLRKIPFEKIGQTLGMSKSAACKAYYRALHRIPLRHAKEIVTEELETLDRMESRLWREIEKPDVEVRSICALAQRLLGIQQRRAKLLGLDAPQQLDVSVLKPEIDNASSLRMEQQRLERLTPEDKRTLLLLLAKMSAESASLTKP